MWSGQREAAAYFATRVERAPEALAGRLTAAASRPRDAWRRSGRYLLDEYGRAPQGTPDAVGPERYARWVRYWNGIDLDLDDAYAYGWDEFHRLDAELRAEAERVLPGSTPLEAMRHLDEHGPAIEGDEVLREWLQGLMTEAIAALDGRHFDLAPELHKVEARLAPPGGAGGGVLHAAVGGLQPSGLHLVPHPGSHPLPDLGEHLDLVPRGRPRPSPAAGPVDPAEGRPVPLPDDARLGERELRGLGALRRAAHGRARLLRGPRPPARASSSASSCGPCGS